METPVAKMPQRRKLNETEKRLLATLLSFEIEDVYFEDVDEVFKKAKEIAAKAFWNK